jgi:large subunit ribosomal protein L20
MTRVKTGKIRRLSHKKTLKLAEGFYGSQSKLFRTANQRVMKAHLYAYTDRKKNKRNFKTLWIIRINSAGRQFGISYHKIIYKLKSKKVKLNKKILSQIILQDNQVFEQLIK